MCDAGEMELLILEQYKARLEKASGKSKLCMLQGQQVTWEKGGGSTR